MYSAVVTAVHRDKHGADYPWKLLFEPLGITSAVWERDGSGVPVGSSYLYMTPRDGARYGTMLLNDGCWNGERILPAGWVDALRQNPPSTAVKAYGRDGGRSPGWNVWLNQPIPPDETTELPMPAAPADMYGALGHWRQQIWVMPSQDLVVVRFGDDRSDAYSANDLAPKVVALADKVKPAPRIDVASDEAASDASNDSAAADDGATDGAAAAPTEAADHGTNGADDAADDGVTAQVAAPAADTADSGPSFPMLTAADRPAPNAEPAAVPPKKYDVGLLKLATSWASTGMCSCMFVSGGSEERCKNYVRVSPEVAKVKVDTETKTVTSRALGMAKTQARWISERQGCSIVRGD